MKSRTYEIIRLSKKDLNSVVKEMIAYCNDVRYYYTNEHDTESTYPVEGDSIKCVFNWLKTGDPIHLESDINPVTVYIDSQLNDLKGNYTSTEISDYYIRAHYYIYNQIVKSL